MATIKDVAQAAQVSTAAVSRVLNKDDNISVSPEVRARIFQAAHVLGYVSPRQRKAAEHKTHLVIGVADWRIIRPDRHNVRLSSLSCLVQMMTDQYEVTFVRLTFGEPQKVDGIIALGVFSEKEIDFLRSLSFAIVFVNSNQHNYECVRNFRTWRNLTEAEGSCGNPKKPEFSRVLRRQKRKKRGNS